MSEKAGDLLEGCPVLKMDRGSAGSWARECCEMRKLSLLSWVGCCETARPWQEIERRRAMVAEGMVGGGTRAMTRKCLPWWGALCRTWRIGCGPLR